MSEALDNIAKLPDISFINNYTLEDIQSRLINSFQEHYQEITGEKIRLAKADPYRLMLLASASVLYQGFQNADKAGKMNFLKYSYGDYLKNLAAFKNIKEKEPVAASVTVRWSLAEARAQATSIPAGSRVTGDNEIYFETTEYNEIPIGSTYIDIVMTCTITGEDGNGYIPGELNIDVDETPYIDSVENIDTSRGGEGTETDDSIKERTYLAPSGYSTAGPEDAYIFHAKNYDSNIGDVYIDSSSAGVVDVRFLMDDGSIPGSGIISGLQEYLSAKDKRPLTDNVVVAAPTQITYNITGTYYINKSDRDRAVQIQQLVVDAVSEYITWQRSRIGRDINPDELQRRIINAGAKRVVLTAPVFTTLTTTQVAALGTKSMTYGGIEDD